MGLDLLRLQARRQPAGQKGPTQLSAAVRPAPEMPGADELVAAANGILVALSDSKECRVCSGASWLGKHTINCPVPQLEKALRKSRVFTSTKPEENPVVHRDENDNVFVHGIPWNRWIYLNTAQRVDCISRRSHKPRAIRITCEWCDDKTFIVTPLKSGQRISECWDCWSVRSRGLEGIKIAVKEALTKARWAEKQTSTRAVHRRMAREHKKRAAAMIRILKAAEG